ncbi:hypothetical protein D3C81_1271580 [compost metagenome]
MVECPIQSVVAILQIKQVLECLITEALQPYSLLLELDVTEPSVQYPQAGAQQLLQAGTGFAAAAQQIADPAIGQTLARVEPRGLLTPSEQVQAGGARVGHQGLEFGTQ